MQRSAPSDPGLALLRRDASAARGSPGRFAAVARGRRCLWSQMGARRCPVPTTARPSPRTARRPSEDSAGRKTKSPEGRYPSRKKLTAPGERLSKASALSACKRLRTIKKDSQTAARLLAHGGGRARAKQRLGQPPDLK